MALAIGFGAPNPVPDCARTDPRMARVCRRIEGRQRVPPKCKRPSRQAIGTACGGVFRPGAARSTGGRHCRTHLAASLVVFAHGGLDPGLGHAPRLASPEAFVQQDFSLECRRWPNPDATAALSRVGRDGAGHQPLGAALARGNFAGAAFRSRCGARAAHAFDGFGAAGSPGPRCGFAVRAGSGTASGRAGRTAGWAHFVPAVGFGTRAQLE